MEGEGEGCVMEVSTDGGSTYTQYERVDHASGSIKATATLVALLERSTKNLRARMQTSGDVEEDKCWVRGFVATAFNPPS